MCEPKKIHVFLGAPPPSSDTEPGQECDGHHQSGLRHLELTWTEGRLRPLTGSAENDCLTETSKGQDKKLQTSCNPNGENECSSGADHESAEGSDPDKEDQCSASVHEYLDSCFPAAQPEPEPNPSHCCEPKSLESVVPLRTENDYLATWTLSQALILRGSQSTSSPVKNLSTQKPPQVQSPSPASSNTPELFSPITPSPEASVELFSQICTTEMVEQRGVLLQATVKGVLYSQEAEPKTAHSLKKARKSEDLRTETPRDKVRSVGLYTSTTHLINCQKPNVKYCVLVVAVHPSHIKEVKMKSTGTFVPLASLVVTDQSDVELKVVLWRRAAFWAVAVTPGDILLITDLQVMEDRWRGETILQSTFSSKMLSLGHVAASTQPTAPQHVDAQLVSALCVFLRERRPLLASLPPPVHQDLKRVPYTSLSSLRANMLVNILLRVRHAHMSSEWREEAESRCRSARHSKVVLTVEQADGQQGVLLLWGASRDWLPRFTRDSGGVWDFRVLLVRDSLSSDCLELHSTPWSSCRHLQSTDRRLQNFLSPRRSLTVDGTVELDVDTLLSQQYSGFVELRVHVMSFRFQNIPSSQNAPVLLDSTTTLEGILELLSEDVTYSGCGRCAAELRTDANSIYIPCYPCLPHTSVRHYYRSAVLTVSGRGCTSLCVQVPPIALQEVLHAPPDKLQRSSAPGSLIKHIQVAAERLQALLSLPKKTFVITIRSNFLCDENSIILSQDFTLLNLQFPR